MFYQAARFIVCAAVACGGATLFAQEGGTTGTGGTGPAPGVGVTDTSGAISPVPGTSPGTPTPSATVTPSEVSAPAEPPATPVTIPGAYGAASITVTPGAGRFSQPKFKITAGISNGYDDNIYTTPTDPEELPDVILDETGEVVKNPETPREKTGSVVSQATVGVQWQGANPRTVYTVDAVLGTAYYWNRDVDPLEYSGSVSLLFLHKVSPRITFSTAGRLGYQPQPDFSRVDSPTRVGSGSYFTLDWKADLAYQWAARFSTVVSGSVNATIFEESASEQGNVINQTVGLQARYLWTPRLTAVLEGRTEQSTHTNAEDANSTSQFFLFGADYALSRRLTATLRLGEQIRLYDFSGDEAQSSPYAESTLVYAYGKSSTINWNNRYGLEDSGNAGNEAVSYRTGVQVNHVLTARLTASLGLNYNRRSTTFLNDRDTEEIVENQFSLGLQLRYVFTRSLSFNISYSRDDIRSSVETSNYIRNRTFFGVDYVF